MQEFGIAVEFFITSKTQNQGKKNLEETGLAYEDKHTEC